jgi:hypothetical protein
MEGAMTTTQREPYPFVTGLRITFDQSPKRSATKVIDMFGDWLRQRRELNELIEYEAEFGELEGVASDTSR